MKKIVTLMVALLLMISLSGCGGGNDQVVIYSNADEEALNVIKKTLDENGYEGKYVAQALGTNELGGKLIAEGTNIEADLITMSSFYEESAQEQKKMFKSLDIKAESIDQVHDFYLPMLGIEGALLINTEVLAKENLPKPTSIKDLTNPVYKGHLSVVDVDGSTTAWLMIQALINEYGEEETKEILTAIYQNAADHLEESGSGPLKKIRAGEVAIGFGLRHQAVADKKEGKPIDFVDPTEGTFSLTESYAVIDKGDKSNPLAAEMAKVLVDNARPAIMEYYPTPLYKGEKAGEASSPNQKKFGETLTLELLQKHQKLSNEAKAGM